MLKRQQFSRHGNSFLRIARYRCFLLTLLLAAGCGTRASDPAHPGKRHVTLLAAASTTEAIADIKKQFELQHPEIELRVSMGPSNGLARQILSGAPADIYLSANTKWAAEIDKAKQATAAQDLLTNLLVLVVPKENPAGIKSIADVTDKNVARVAIAGESVPAGMYAEQALRHAKVFQELLDSNRLVRGSNVRVTMAYVERGEAEVGIVYATDARISQQAQLIATLPAESYDPIVYPLVLLKQAEHNQDARLLFTFLQSDAADTTFSNSGFTPLSAKN